MFRLNRNIHFANGRHIIVSLLICGIIVAIGFALRHYFVQPPARTLTTAELAELEAFSKEMSELEKEDSIRRSHWKHQEEDICEEPFPFDPNTADSATLRRLGLRPWQIRNMMKYRRRGGYWRSPDDFSRLYGLDRRDFERLRPYIRVTPLTTSKHEKEDTTDRAPRFTKVEKYAEGTVIDLNTADTTALKHIPGIGSYYAGKICRYRERLGGFVSTDQIEEVEGLPEGIKRWFCVAPHAGPRRINVNKASFKELVRHPYLSYEQVKIICDYRQKYGKLKNWHDLNLYDEFDQKHTDRLQPYFVF